MSWTPGPPRAEAILRKALDEDPEPQPWTDAGVGDAVRLQPGRAEEAERIYRHVIEAARSTPSADADAFAVSASAWSYYRLGQPEKAARRCAKALSLDPTQVSSQFDLAVILVSGGHLDDALREYEGGIAMTARRSDALFRRGVLATARVDLLHLLEEREDLRDDRRVVAAMRLIDDAFAGLPDPIEETHAANGAAVHR
jgi:tetratricopeptide (TPR) repeat protein